MSTTVATLSLPEDLEFAELRLEIDLDNERSASARAEAFFQELRVEFIAAQPICVPYV